MKFIWTRLLAVAMAVLAAMTLTVSEVEAKRLGGGKSIGKQSSSVTQRDAMPPAGAPAQAGAPNRAAGAQSAAPGAAAAKPAGSRWMAPLAGLAAGLGLAALASHLGFGEELANFMMLALLVLAAIFVVRMLMARRGAASGPRPAYQGGYSNANVGQEASVRYSPLPAGHDASMQRAPVTDLGGTAAAAAQTSWRVPADMDVDAFLRTAKVQFVRLQASFDSGNLDDLREFTSPEMFAELKLDIDDRKGAANRTDVVTLDAQLLGVETTPVEHIASVRFTGMIREQADGEAKPFDEVWNLVKPVNGGGWVLGGIQQLD